MRLLRRSRTELAGAWRSLCYDMGRRPQEPAAGGPDMTSTGMSTFGGAELTGYTATGDVPIVRQRTPRWLLAIPALGALSMAGAAAAYFGVVNGMGSLVPATPAAADAFPVRPMATSSVRRGQGPAPRNAVRATATAGAPEPVHTAASVRPPAVVPTTDVRTPAAVRPAEPASPDCHCDSPPVPTPTAPTAPTASPSPSPWPSDSIDPWPSASSATPDESAEPGRIPQSRHHPRRRRLQIGLLP